jgi:hypothetical protein
LGGLRGLDAPRRAILLVRHNRMTLPSSVLYLDFHSHSDDFYLRTGGDRNDFPSILLERPDRFHEPVNPVAWELDA